MTEAEVHLRKAVELAPETYDANHNLGELYVQLNKLQEAIPYLKRAQEINPSAYNNGYDLSLAYENTGNLEQARQQLEETHQSKRHGRASQPVRSDRREK